MYSYGFVSAIHTATPSETMALSRHDIDRRLENLLAICRREGVRLTQQRMEIFREVARTEAHPDAETVHERVRERLPRVSLDTVYRTLSSMEAIGLVGKVSACHGAARFDGNPKPHDHFICTRCGLVRDVQDPAHDRPPHPGAPVDWGEVQSVHTEYRGVCTDCLRKSKRAVGS